jgi:hypothetical protein
MSTAMVVARCSCTPVEGSSIVRNACGVGDGCACLVAVVALMHVAISKSNKPNQIKGTESQGACGGASIVRPPSWCTVWSGIRIEQCPFVVMDAPTRFVCGYPFKRIAVMGSTASTPSPSGKKCQSAGYTTHTPGEKAQRSVSPTSSSSQGSAPSWTFGTVSPPHGRSATVGPDHPAYLGKSPSATLCKSEVLCVTRSTFTQQDHCPLCLFAWLRNRRRRPNSSRHGPHGAVIIRS